MTMCDSASAIIQVIRSGSHLLQIEGYSRTKELPDEENIQSQPFNVAGRTWRVQYSYRGEGGMHTMYICLKLVLLHSIVPFAALAQATFVLLDQAGNEVPAFTRRIDWNEYRYAYVLATSDWFTVQIEREAVEASGLIVNDSLKIRCDIAVVEPRRTETRGHWTPSTMVPPPDLHSHLSRLLEAREGADVTFQVAGEAFSAHKCILAARSPVFKAELFGAMKESTNTGVCIRIDDMAPQVFKALLHFIYTDSLPGMEGQEEALMAQHLLEAADRYAMQRLKLICEEKLCRCLDVKTIAGTMVLAEQHSCHRLKEACFEFLKSSQSLQDVMATSGFEHLTKCCPALLRELISELTDRSYMSYVRASETRNKKKHSSLRF